MAGASALRPGLSLSMTSLLSTASLLSTGAPAASGAAMLPAVRCKSWAQGGSHLLTLRIQSTPSMYVHERDDGF